MSSDSFESDGNEVSEEAGCSELELLVDGVVASESVDESTSEMWTELTWERSLERETANWNAVTLSDCRSQSSSVGSESKIGGDSKSRPDGWYFRGGTRRWGCTQR